MSCTPVPRSRRAIANPPDTDGVIVGASVHYGRHPGFLRAMLRGCRESLAARANAFFSVSLSAGGDTDVSRDYEYTDWQAAERFAMEFQRRVRASDVVPAKAGPNGVERSQPYELPSSIRPAGRVSGNAALLPGSLIV